MEFSRQKYWSSCHSLLQGIFPTQGLNLGLLHCRQILYHLSYQGRPNFSCKNKKNWDYIPEIWVPNCPPVFYNWVDCEASVSTNSFSCNQVIAHYILWGAEPQHLLLYSACIILKPGNSRSWWGTSLAHGKDTQLGCVNAFKGYISLGQAECEHSPGP